MPKSKRRKKNKKSILAKMNNKRSMPIVKQIKKWLLEVPDKEKADMEARIYSEDEVQYGGAFFELMIPAFLKTEGFELEKHPKLGLKRPDYLVKDKDKEPLFYLEIITAFSSENILKGRSAFKKLRYEINKIKEDSFYINIIYIDEYPTHNIIYKNIRNDIQLWINKFDAKNFPSEDSKRILKYLIKDKKTEEKCVVHFQIYLKRTPRNNGIVESYMIPMASGSVTSKKIRDSIRTKLKKYKKIKDIRKSLVIVVCSTSGEFATNLDNVMAELFGHEEYVISSKGAYTKRKPNGLFKSNLNTRLSAVIYCKRSWSYGDDAYSYEIKIIHNPYAAHPLEECLFSNLPQFVKMKNRSECQWINDNGQVIVL